MQWSRSVGVLATVGVVGAALIGCGVDDDPDRPEPGPPARLVKVVRGDEIYPVTAEIKGWVIRPNPQTPARGDAVEFEYRFTGDAPERIELQACAIDDRRVVLLCDYISNTEGDDDGSIGPYPGAGLARTASVVLVPDQMFAGINAGDIKDHDGYVPPRSLSPGDRL